MSDSTFLDINQNQIDREELERYVRIYQENPDSRVFAPLADFYRRLGRLDEAELICREGISRHPYYPGGRVALAHVLLDQSKFELALAESEHVVTYYPDNLLARKILIRVLGGLGRLDRARRELQALEALAPQMIHDPEIEKALQGPSSQKFLSESPMRLSPQSGESRPDLEKVFSKEAQASIRMIHLLRKKMILGAWIQLKNRGAL
jgi:tetratricopeptide (TPR) repeat protein